MKYSEWVLVGIGIAMAALLIVIAAPGAKATQTGDTYLGWGDWDINQPTEVSDEAVWVDGNININSELTLNNAAIYFTSWWDGEYTLTVNSDGTFYVYGSTITDSYGSHYSFQVFGTMDIDNSYISEMYGDPYSWVGGIQLYSDDCSIEDSTITYGQTGGIYIYQASPRIYNNDICYNGNDGYYGYYWYGIYVEGTDSTSCDISSNRIYSNGYDNGWSYDGTGIRSMYQSNNDLIADNSIYDNGYNTWSYYCYGTQIYLYSSNPTIRDNQLSNGQYCIYIESSNPPTITGGSISTYPRNWMTSYGVYASNSVVGIDGTYFTTSYEECDHYGIYAYYSEMSVANCTFDYPNHWSWNWHTDWSISMNYYSDLTVTNCDFRNDDQYSMYAIYAYYYCEVNIVDSDFQSNSGNGYYYAIQAQSYCPVSLLRTHITASANDVYAIYVYDSSPLTIEGCGITIQNSYNIYGIQAGYNCEININDTSMDFIDCPGSWSMYGIYAYSGSDITVSNFTADLQNMGGYYWYFFYAEQSELTINDSRITDVNNQVQYQYYFIYMGWDGKDLYMSNVTAQIERNSMDSWPSFAFIQGGGYNSNPGCTIVGCDFTITTTGSFDGVRYDEADLEINRSSFNVTVKGSQVDEYSGSSFTLLYLYRADGLLRNSTFAVQCYKADSGYIAGAYSWDGDYKLVMDNCTALIETMTPPLYDYSSLSVLDQFENCRAIIGNSTITTRNSGGNFNVRAFNLYRCTDLEVTDTDFIAVYGNGNGIGLPDLAVNQFQEVQTMNYTRCTMDITVVDEPAVVYAFEFWPDCGNLNIKASTLNMTIDAPGSSAGLLKLYEDEWSKGGVRSIDLERSDVTFLAKRADDTANLLRITSETSENIGSVDASGSKVTLTFLAPSATPSYAVQIIGSDFSLSNLALYLNAPAGDTVLVGIGTDTAAPALNNITIHGNGQGRTYGVLCDIVSRPSINNTQVDNCYAGVYSQMVSMPQITGCLFTNCTYGVFMTAASNGTMVGSTIISNTGVGFVGGSYLAMTDSSMTTTVHSIDLDGASTAWLLNTTFDKPSVIIRDAPSTLIVNWLLQLKVTWQNGLPIPGAQVRLSDNFGNLFFDTFTDDGALIPYSPVVEYVRVGPTTVTSFSPYKANASFEGFSSVTPITVDKTKAVDLTISDDTFPVVTILSPDEGIYQNFTTVVVSGTAYDLGSGMSALNISYDGKTWASIPAGAAWIYAIEVPEGDWTIAVKLVDRCGNEVSDSRTIHIDLTPPSIDIISPENNHLGNVIGVDLTGQVELGSVLTLNHRPVVVNADGTFVYPVRLVEGANTFTFFARDLAGNTNTTSWTLWLDITPPMLAVTAPLDGLITNQTAVMVRGSTEIGSDLRVNGALVTLDEDGMFAVTLDLTPGTNTINITATDLAGNSAKLLRTVLMDNELNINIISPTENMFTNQITMLVKGVIDTDSVLRLNDGIVAIGQDGTFTVTFSLGEGTNELVFSAADRAGNTARVVRHVILDTVRPSLEVTSPEDGKVYKVREITVKGTCEAGINLTVNGQTVPTDTGSFSLSVNLPEGSSMVEVIGTDAAGNKVTVRVPVIIDLTPPSLEIVEPLKGFRTAELSVIVVGVTEPGAIVKVNGVQVAVDAFGKFSTSVNLQKGKNTITITAADAAGNEAPSQSVDVNAVRPTQGGSDNSWWWTIAGFLIALGIGFPLTLIYVAQGLRARGKEG